MLKIIRPTILKIKEYSHVLLIAASVFFLSGTSSDKIIKLTEIEGRGYIALNELIDLLNIENSFDPVYQKGRLYYNNHYMVFKVGFSAIIIDNSIYSSEYEIIRNNGAVLIPEDMAEAVITAFFTNMAVSLTKGRLVVSPKSKDKNTGEKIVASVKGRIGFIIIDAGHGGKDPGAIGKGGLQEKRITLQIALKLQTLLSKKYSNIKIKMTRTSDRFIELARRTDIANRELKKDVNGIFISIHVNASISPKISGFETYFLSQNPTNDEARKTAALENNVIILEKDNVYDDVEYMEALMITTQIQKESGLLADYVQKNLDRKVSEFKSRGVHTADFFVLRGALMPAVLVETGFITNRKESVSLTKNSYQDKIASGICDGIIKFINEYNKMIEQ